MPSFLESKQSVSPDNSWFKDLFRDKKRFSIVVLTTLVLAIPLTVWLAQRAQIFRPKADIRPIELMTGQDSCVVSSEDNKVKCSSFPIKLTSPLGPRTNPSPSPHIEPGATCASDNQCAQGQECFNHQNFPGTCRNEDTVCLQVITYACDSQSSGQCADFPTPCHVPPGWVVTPSSSASPAASASASLTPSPSASQSAQLKKFDYLVGQFGRILESNLFNFEPIKKAFAQQTGLNCLQTELSLTTPTSIPNSKKADTDLVFWNQSVSRSLFLQKALECNVEILNPNNFSASQVKQLVESVVGVPINSSDGTKMRNIILEGPCTAAKLSSYQTQGNTILIDSQCDEEGIDLKVNIYYGPGSGADPFGIYNGIADGGSNGYPLIVTSNLTSSPSPSPSSSPATSPSPSSNLPGTAFYKMAETEAGLTNAQRLPYVQHPTITEFTFSDNTPGIKQIWVEFISPDNSSRKEHISVKLVEPDPVITSLDCSMDVSKQNLKVTLNGLKLGDSAGSVKVDSKEAQITSWGQTQVTAIVDPAGNVETGKLYKVVLTKRDGQVFPEITCRVDTALISLGARLFCRAPGQFDVNGVKVVIVDENGGKVNEEVTIDSNGIINGLKTKLQVGKPYTISIKAPVSLRKNADFIASNGTTIVTPRDDEIFILPVGDIFPIVLPDGKINTPDRSEIVRQWSVLGAGNTRTGDFNRDTKVNSIDWACMRYDFNKEDEKIPDKAKAGPGPSGTPVNPQSSPSAASASVTVSPSAISSSTPVPSGQRSAFFLLDPLEGGSYKNGDEFIVDVNIWSQTEAANLFVAKIGFDAQVMEVVSIEKGSALTSWAEEFFDNPTGRISLVAGRPSPGLQTTEGSNPRMARIIFKAKNVGVSEIRLTSESKIYSNSDNINILNSLLSAQIAITN